MGRLGHHSCPRCCYWRRRRRSPLVRPCSNKGVPSDLDLPLHCVLLDVTSRFQGKEESCVRRGSRSFVSLPMAASPYSSCATPSSQSSSPSQVPNKKPHKSLATVDTSAGDSNHIHLTSIISSRLLLIWPTKGRVLSRCKGFLSFMAPEFLFFLLA